MAKKKKDDVPNVNSVANRDILHRLNFLYQASAYLDSISPPSLTLPAQPPAHDAGSNLAGPSTPAKNTPTESSKKIKKRSKKEARGRNMQVTEIARSYVRSMKQIGEKTTVRMDPTIKRSLCKGCDSVLIIGLTASCRVNHSKHHGHTVITMCYRCKTRRRIPAPPIDQDALVANQKNDGVVLEQSGTPSASVSVPDGAPKENRTARKRAKVRPRAQPLFERDAGHVIFRGEERLE